jgi:hypothetical protein
VDLMMMSLRNRAAALLTCQKIEEMSKLRPGWCYGEGCPIDRGTVSLARELDLFAAALAQDSLQTDAFPGLNGEVMLTLYRGARYAEITIRPDRLIDCFWELWGQEAGWEEGIGASRAKDSLVDFSAAFEHPDSLADPIWRHVEGDQRAR